MSRIDRPFDKKPICSTLYYPIQIPLISMIKGQQSEWVLYYLHSFSVWTSDGNQWKMSLHFWNEIFKYYQKTTYFFPFSRLVRPGQLAGNSERARGIFFSLLCILIFIYFLNTKLLSVEMACLLGIQNEIQAVCNHTEILQDL